MKKLMTWFITLMIAGQMQAANYDWIPGTVGDFNEDGNWRIAGAPGPEDGARITRGTVYFKKNDITMKNIIAGFGVGNSSTLFMTNVTTTITANGVTLAYSRNSSADLKMTNSQLDLTATSGTFGAFLVGGATGGANANASLMITDGSITANSFKIGTADNSVGMVVARGHASISTRLNMDVASEVSSAGTIRMVGSGVKCEIGEDFNANSTNAVLCFEADAKGFSTINADGAANISGATLEIDLKGQAESALPEKPLISAGRITGKFSCVKIDGLEVSADRVVYNYGNITLAP